MRRRSTKTARLLCMAALLGTVIATSSVSAERPTVGLVLSGGGAKGIAHVGVLQVLEQLQVPVDFVVGTSMGAIVGGLYCQGYSPDALQQQVLQIDWADVLQDASPRQYRSNRLKALERGFPKQFSAGLRRGDFVFPQGFVQGQRMMTLLRELSFDASRITDFDELPIPFRATAVDLHTGELVTLGEGSLALAMRASMAIPGLIAPVTWGDRVLVDGGIANNLPVDLAHEMGADRVIVVDVGGDGHSQSEMTSPFSVMNQALHLMIRQNVEQQRATLTGDDIYIEPDVSPSGIGTVDFDRAGLAISVGENAALAAENRLSELALDDAAWESHLAGIRTSTTEKQRLDFIRLDNRSELSDRIIRSRMTLEPGDTLDIDQLNADLERIYGMGYFESVDYRSVHTEAGQGIEITVIPRSWGPQYLSFGLALEDDFDANASYRAALTYHRTMLNRLGAEFMAEMEIGREPGLTLDYWQPLATDVRFYINPAAEVRRRENNIFRDGEQIGIYRVTRQDARLDLGFYTSNATDIQVGVRRGLGEAEARVQPPDAPKNLNFQTGTAHVQMLRDTLDDSFFPTRGQLMSIRYEHSDALLGADDDYERITARALGAFSLDRNVFLGALRLGTFLSDEAPVHELYSLGGFLNLSGYQRNELTGSHLAHGQLAYLRRVTAYRTWGGLPVYLGGAIEAGNVWDSDQKRSANDLIHTASVLAAADTPIGMAYLGLGGTEDGRSAAYFSLGTVF